MRHFLQLMAVFLIVLGGGYWGYLRLFEEEVLPERETPGLTVLEIEGSVVRRIGGDEAPIEAGDRVGESDGLRVGADGHAVLGLGEDARLYVEADSTIRVMGVDNDGVVVELEEGRVKAKVKAGSPGIQVSHRDQSARTQGGAFSMSVSGQDEVLVQSEDGRVSLQGFGERSDLEPGHYVHAAPGEPIISAAQAEELLLHIEWPSEGRRRESGLALEGETLPNMRVQVQAGGQSFEARADDAGKFHVELQLQEGTNSVEVSAADPLGKRVAQERQFELDNTAPQAMDMGVQWQP